MSSTNSFGIRTPLKAGSRSFEIYSLPALEAAGFSEIARLPFSLKILLENLLRHEDGRFVKAADIEALARWDVKSARAEGNLVRAGARPAPGLHRRARRGRSRRHARRHRCASAAIRNASTRCSRSSSSSTTRCRWTTSASRMRFQLNAELEFSRNKERYAFLRWGQNAFRNFRVVPPDTGIVHQVNLEYLARVVLSARRRTARVAYPDTLVGTDSHTTMVNGLGVVGWGVGGIEAEAAMLGQPISMLIPPVLGFRLTGAMLEGATATDLVLTITERLRKHGVVGKFVEFFGPGLEHSDHCRPRDARQHVPGVRRDDRDLPDRRDDARLPAPDRPRRGTRRARRSVREGAGAVPHGRRRPIRCTTETIELDLGTVEPSLAGPRRPQDRVSLKQAKSSFQAALDSMLPARQERPSNGCGAGEHGERAVAWPCCPTVASSSSTARW